MGEPGFGFEATESEPTEKRRLPSGDSETGTWSVSSDNEPREGGIGGAAISFPFPLAAAPEHVEYVAQGKTGEHCAGSAAAPTAPSGYLCVYATAEESARVKLLGIQNLAGNPGASAYGAFVMFEAEETPEPSEGIRMFNYGTWAVTAQ
jgi:hypothetical protein